MPTTPTYGLRYPAPTDPADVPTDMGHLATDVETALSGRAAVVGSELIQAVTLAAPGQIAFTSIPQTFRSLLIVASLQSAADAAGDYDIGCMRFNGSTTSYYNQRLNANGTVVTADMATADVKATVGWIPDSPAGGSPQRGGLEVLIPQYNTASGFKPWSSHGAAGGTNAGIIFQCGGIWTPVAAITRIDLFAIAAPNNFVAGSYASLYGLR